MAGMLTFIHNELLRQLRYRDVAYTNRENKYEILNQQSVISTT